MATDDDKIALIAVSNPITSGRINTILNQKGWITHTCSDGDVAVDNYVKLKPHLVFLSIDLTIIDGHVAALEIRETDVNARIVFVSSKTRMAKAQEVAFSAGAVGIISTPLTQSKVDNIWEKLFLDIPDAPGLADLDILYPELPERKITEDTPMPMPMPMPFIEGKHDTSPKKKRNIFANIKILVLILSGIILSSAGLLYLEIISF